MDVVLERSGIRLSLCVSICHFVLPSSGFLWSPVAGQVFHCVAEPILDNDAVHSRFRHPQLLPDSALRLAVLPQVHHPLPLPHIVLLGLLASGGRPSGGSPGGGFCGGRQAADCSGDSERGAGKSHTLRNSIFNFGGQRSGFTSAQQAIAVTSRSIRWAISLISTSMWDSFDCR